MPSPYLRSLHVKEADTSIGPQPPPPEPAAPTKYRSSGGGTACVSGQRNAYACTSSWHTLHSSEHTGQVVRCGGAQRGEGAGDKTKKSKIHGAALAWPEAEAETASRVLAHSNQIQSAPAPSTADIGPILKRCSTRQAGEGVQAAAAARRRTAFQAAGGCAHRATQRPGGRTHAQQSGAPVAVEEAIGRHARRAARGGHFVTPRVTAVSKTCSRRQGAAARCTRRAWRARARARCECAVGAPYETVLARRGVTRRRRSSEPQTTYE